MTTEALTALSAASRALAEVRAERDRIVNSANLAVYGIEELARQAGVAKLTLEDQVKAIGLLLDELGVAHVDARIRDCEDVLLAAMHEAELLTSAEIFLTRHVPAARVAAVAAGMCY